MQEAVKAGIAADARGKDRIEKLLKKEKEKSKKLTGLQKEIYDEERTWNPFPDSRIIAGTGEEEVKTLMVGIDIETPEMLLADRLREKGQKIDALMIHHPEGRALADLEKQMPLQVDVYNHYGVPVNQTEHLLQPRMGQIWRSIHSNNLYREERAAELLDFPAFVTHTIADNLVWRFVDKQFCNKEFDDLDSIINALLKIPEYKEYAKRGNPPIIAAGSKSSRPGKVVATEFTGGTNGPEDLVASQAQAGVGTILSMHATEKTLKAAKKHHINIIQCSHMGSDTLGMNLLLDKLTKVEPKLNTIDVSGFFRIKRK